MGHLVRVVTPGSRSRIRPSCPVLFPVAGPPTPRRLRAVERVGQSVVYRTGNDCPVLEEWTRRDTCRGILSPKEDKSDRDVSYVVR